MSDRSDMEDTPSRATSAPQHRLFDIERFEEGVQDHMGTIRDSSRRMQAALGIEPGTKMVLGKCYEMPRPLGMEVDTSDDDNDSEGNSENDDDDDDDDDDGEDDRKSIMDDEDMGQCDDGVYESEEESEEESPSPASDVRVYEDEERADSEAEGEDSEDELSSAADVMSVDRENVAPVIHNGKQRDSHSPKVKAKDDNAYYEEVLLPPRPEAPTNRSLQGEKVAVLHKRVPQIKGGCNNEAAPHPLAAQKQEIPGGNEPIDPDQTTNGNGSRFRPEDIVVPPVRTNHAGEQIPAGNKPVNPDQAANGSAARLRPENIVVPPVRMNHADELMAIPTVNIIKASPGPVTAGFKLNDLLARGPGYPQSAPLPEMVPFDTTHAWLRSLPPTTAQFANPFNEAEARLANLTEVLGPDRLPSVEAICMISAPVQMHLMNQGSPGDVIQLPGRTQSPQGRLALEPEAAARNLVIEGRRHAIHQRQNMAPPHSAPLTRPHQPPFGANHVPSQAPTHVRASPPPAYHSPPRMANRLEAPSYWSSLLSTSLYCWYRHVRTRAVQCNLTGLAFTLVQKTNPPVSPIEILRFDARFFAKVKCSRVLLPEEARCASRAVPIRDWIVIELMSDTHMHGPAELARNDPNQTMPFNQHAFNRQTSLATPLPSPNEKPYWLLAFPAHAITNSDARQVFTGQGLLTKTRVSVGREGFLPLLHGRSVNPWFLEQWVSAFARGEGGMEIMSQQKLPL